MTTYKFVTLDDPLEVNPENGTHAFGVNDSGEVVGYYYDPSGNAHGFLYSAGGYTTLDYAPGTADQTFATGINARGQIVGWYNDLSADHGFVYSGGVYTALNDPLATVNTFATGINNAGQIVGYYQDAGSAGGLINHGFLYSRGVYTPIDDPLAYAQPGGTANGTIALGVNNRGDVVGYYFDMSGSTTGVENAFLYSGGKYTTIDDPLGVTGTIATGINNAGQIVGYYFDSLHNEHGFLYSGGKYTTIDDPLGDGTFALGINDRGQIVGDYYIGNVEHGFLATPHAQVGGTDHINHDTITLAGVSLSSLHFDASHFLLV